MGSTALSKALPPRLGLSQRLPKPWASEALKSAELRALLALGFRSAAEDSEWKVAFGPRRFEELFDRNQVGFSKALGPAPSPCKGFERLGSGAVARLSPFRAFLDAAPPKPKPTGGARSSRGGHDRVSVGLQEALTAYHWGAFKTLQRAKREPKAAAKPKEPKAAKEAKAKAKWAKAGCSLGEVT
ncbi:unnamed protein product [Symbiodinium sp. CCMP2592]|nr:unnamed protein product [Symbiodinium sp. CCMP2592]